MDDVVIGADSSATFGTYAARTIEQSFSKKIEVVGNTNPLIVAGTGFIGHHQRFVETVKTAHAKGEFKGKSELDVARNLSRLGTNDFGQTNSTHNLYSALVAYCTNNKPVLCELDGAQSFQPELKASDGLWFASMGSGITITDPILALFRSIFWANSTPDLRGGVFTAYWALHHACEVNPGGINHPIRISTLRVINQQAVVQIFSEDDLQETRDLVSSAIEHVSGFRDVLLGNNLTTTPPPKPT